MNIIQSRNKREGKYVGHVKGFAFRSHLTYCRVCRFYAWEEVYRKVSLMNKYKEKL